MSLARRYLALLHTLPCVVCLNCYGRTVLAQEAHHLEHVRGRHSSFACIPLCKSCHDSLHHERRRAFHLAHKTDDLKLLSWTVRLLVARIERAMPIDRGNF